MSFLLYILVQLELIGAMKFQFTFHRHLLQYNSQNKTERSLTRRETTIISLIFSPNRYGHIFLVYLHSQNCFNYTKMQERDLGKVKI